MNGIDPEIAMKLFKLISAGENNTDAELANLTEDQKMKLQNAVQALIVSTNSDAYSGSGYLP